MWGPTLHWFHLEWSQGERATGSSVWSVLLPCLSATLLQKEFQSTSIWSSHQWMSGDWCHEIFSWLRNESSVLPITVLWSVSTSLARTLTLSLLLVINNLWKVTYLEASMILECRELEMVLIRYLWVHLSTLNAPLMDTFHDLYNFSQSFENRVRTKPKF